MPFSRLVALAFVGLFAVVNVAAVPLPMDVRAESMLITAKLMARQHAVAQRDLSPFNPIAAYVKRDSGTVSLAFISGPASGDCRGANLQMPDPRGGSRNGSLRRRQRLQTPDPRVESGSARGSL
jgi:hypothetical protein